MVETTTASAAIPLLCTTVPTAGKRHTGIFAEFSKVLEMPFFTDFLEYRSYTPLLMVVCMTFSSVGGGSTPEHATAVPKEWGVVKRWRLN